MPTKKQSHAKLYLGIAVVVIVILAAVILSLVYLSTQQQTNQTKTVSVPTEIKSGSEAASLEQDTSSILGEISDALNNIDASLPEV